ncbi:hypothetical protein [Clostridium folliculivorans]|uniref:Appr-1-p processing protein n=1 Tax=Clostridium folliculivorans TaxID=2886038 RepID=A0A9W5Y1V2_9CLOT|nr:hypothetical protein [Clostridium folliculivorans]GKU25191.1 hypothetical protein CFOLD11_20170 [Clostridium folliculivorans]GKU31289.1 hypothetical protein CFB3_33960 [Clostridium folliculivorans]
MLDNKLLIEIQEYIDTHLNIVMFDVCQSEIYYENNLCEELPSIELEDFINKNRMPTFQQVLFKLIDAKASNELDIYKKAMIDRRHFSKIRSNSDYRPGKNTAIALVLALELNTEEADKLLSTAGYSLSDSDTFDLVIQFCLEKKIYDIDTVNEALDYFSLKPLIGVIK